MVKRLISFSKRGLQWCSQHFGAGIAGLLAFLVYAATVAPGVYGLDSAELATGAHTLGIVHPTGYPLYLLLAKLFTLLPLGTVAYKVNLFSAVFGALTIGVVFVLIEEVSGKRWAAWLGTGMLAFSYNFWSMATVAEVYTLHTFFTALILILFQRWMKTEDRRWLPVIAFVTGLSLTNHVSSVLILPGFALFVLYRIGLRALLKQLPLLFFCGLIGLSFYLYLPVRAAANPAMNYIDAFYNVDLTKPTGLLWMISGQAYHFFSFGYDLNGYIYELGSFVNLLIRNMTGVGLMLGLAGFIFLVMKDRKFAWVSGTAFISNVFFFSGYAVADKSTMFLPSYLIWSVWIAYGAVSLAVVLSSWKDYPLIRSAWPEPLFKTALAIVVGFSCILNWSWVDKSNAYEQEVFAKQVLSTVEPGALVIGQWSSAVVLEYYQQVEGRRTDIEIFNRSRYEVAEYYKYWVEGVSHQEAMTRIIYQEQRYFDIVAEERPIYGVEYDPELAQYYEYKPMGALFMLEPRDG